MLDLTKQIALAFPCAGNDSNPFALRTVLTSPGGYTTFFTNTIKPMYDLGYRVFMLQRPHGEYVIGDQWQDISSSYYLGLSPQAFVITDLDDAFDWAAINMPEAEFIVYLGTHGQDMQDHVTNNELAMHTTKLNAAVANFLPYENIHIAFDQMTTLDNDHPMALFVRDLYEEFRDGEVVESFTGAVTGRRVITEPCPDMTNEDRSWLFDIPSVTSAGLAIKRTILPQFRQAGGSVFHVEWYQLNDRNWDDVPRPELFDYLRYALNTSNFMPVIYENAFSMLGGRTQTQAKKKALRRRTSKIKRNIRIHRPPRP